MVTAKDGKQTYFIWPTEHGYWTLAGLYDVWKGGGEPLETFTIITRDAVDAARHVHARMPALVPRDNYEHWLDTV